MMTLIIGGSGSGKSAYAEEYLTRLAKTGRKYYIATMQVFDGEGQAKIERHRRLRAGKGFCTIEQPTQVERALAYMEGTEHAALVECISNLTANEMFSGEAIRGVSEVAELVTDGIRMLRESTGQLVVVSNNIFEDGICYEETTRKYIKAMGAINGRLAAMADKVIEVVVGIPVVIKD